jgi:hypothetical protein
LLPWKATVFIVIGIDVAVSSTKMFSVAMEMQQWVCFAPFLSYKIFHTAVNNNNY